MMNVKNLLSAAIIGAVSGAISVGLTHLVLSRPAGDSEVIQAAITAAIIVAFARRWGPA